MLARHAGIWRPRGYEGKTGCWDQGLVPENLPPTLQRYGCGAVLLSQVVMVAMLKRTTASSYEQK